VGQGHRGQAAHLTEPAAAWLLLATTGVVVFVLGLVTTGQWAQGTAARTAATFGTGDRGTGEARASGHYGCCPAIFRRAPRSVMVMSRWLVRMMPR
jgi:hypothetical protein